MRAMTHRLLMGCLLTTCVAHSQEWPVAAEATLAGARGVGGPPTASATEGRRRVKDLVQPVGMNSHDLIGYGLVVGLNKTGDSSVSLSSPMMTNLLDRLGLRPGAAAVEGMKSRNVAVVAVTAKLPATACSGDSLEVTVSSLGDAKSIAGGMLLMSLLKGPDGQVYGSAQGRLEPPPSAAARGGEKPAVVGRVAEGGTVSKELRSPALERSLLRLQLHNPDYTTANRIAESITVALGVPARAVSDSLVEVSLSQGGTDAVTLLGQLATLEVQGDQPAAVIIDRSSGTVSVTGQTRVGAATVNRGGITVQIGPEGAEVSTVLGILRQSAASPEDVAAVFEALQRIGALRCDLIFR